MLGMDAARQGYYAAFGGSPGLPYLLREFSAAMDERGLDAGIRQAVVRRQSGPRLRLRRGDRARAMSSASRS